MSYEDDMENAEDPIATIHTSHGDIVVELFENRVPTTVRNFITLATHAEDYDSAEVGPEGEAWEDPESGEKRVDALYDDVAFHRIIGDFMIQGGDPTETGRGGPGYEFEDEFHDDLTHDGPGVLSMANSGPDTNGSQFFVTLDAQPHLDGRHAVFGKVTDGMGVVEAIGNVETDPNDKPLDEVTIDRIEIHD